MGLEVRLPSAAESSEVRLLACVEDAETRETLSRLVTDLGWHGAKICEGGIAAAAQAIDPAAPPTLLVIDLGDSSDPFAALDRLAEHCPPETRVVAVGSANDVSLYRRLIGLGIGDYLPKPVSGDMLRDALTLALRPIERKETAAAGVTKTAQVVTVIGARGGIGTSTIATGLAWCLTQDHGSRVALLDLDLQFGNLALGLDLEPGRGLRDALEHPERIDSLLVAGAMTGTTDTLRVLAAEEPLDDQPALDPSAIDPLVAALSESFDYIVADLPRALDGMARRLLARADRTMIVADLSLAAMRDTQRLAALIEILQPSAKPLVIVNRTGALAGAEIARAEFEKALKRPIDGAVPYDAKAATAMAQHAKPLPAAAKNGKAAAELRRVATMLTGKAKEPPRSLIKRLLG